MLLWISFTYLWYAVNQRNILPSNVVLKFWLYALVCKDDDFWAEKCKEWAEADQCHHSKPKEYCDKSCGRCKGKTLQL